MTSAAGWWSNYTSGDEVSEPIVRCVEWRKFGHWATPIGDDYFLTGLYAIDVLAEPVLEVSDPDL